MLRVFGMNLMYSCVDLIIIKKFLRMLLSSTDAAAAFCAFVTTTKNKNP